MKISINLLILISLLISTYSCSKKSSIATPDTTTPHISISKPTVGQVFVAGNTIPFQATFSDNISLKNYDVAISKVSTGGMILKNVPTSVPFSYVKSSTSFNTGVKQQEITINDITIPTNTATTIVTAGKYNLKVTCVDGSGNPASTTLEISIN